MQIAKIGPWEFEMPDGWALKPNASSPSYFEELDGYKGLYVKSIELSEPEMTPKQAAEYVQRVHLQSFTEATDCSWEIVNNRLSQERGFARSALDLYDAKANYRVLSLVVCNCQSALQVTVHDYLCQHYSTSQDAFAQLESSIAWSPSAA
ncbi:hypothetical protein [Dyella sp.]|uniref:hypothetical protein n=1 Tax=Dyella sp. TaxID=1869338 RepID=UPI003F7E6B55